MQGNKKFFDLVDDLRRKYAGAIHEATTSDDGGGASGSGVPEPDRRDDDGGDVHVTSLECLRNTVRRKEDEGKPDQPVTHVIGDRCKDWFCPHCSQVQGPKLRAKLIDRLLLWRRPFMLTFTIDRDLFESAEQAFLWVTQRRAISRVMKAIKPHLHRADWFCIVEFQVDGGWPHWHVLVDAAHVPIHEVRKAWRRCVPKDRRHLIRPSIDSMGIVRYSKPEGFANARHAGLYASKYLVKYPEDGFPDWVMQARYRIRRYTTSRGFWGVLTHRATPQPRRRAPNDPASHARGQAERLLHDVQRLRRA